MSIIYDALKKVEAKVSLPSGRDEKESIAKKPLNVKLFVICGLVALSGLFIAHIVFSFVASRVPSKMMASSALKSPSVTGVVKQPVSLDLPAQPATLASQPVEAEPVVEEAPQLVLNGVFFSDDGGYALVNNKIVSQGDEINGAKLIEITQEEVVFDYKGKEIRLSTRK